ncbi:MAG: guanylate kinase [bacterium]|nr:guanylate kinase [bacterium]
MQVQRINSTQYNTNFGRIKVNNVPKRVDNMKRVLILSGPSGVGKDTVLNAFIDSTKAIGEKPFAQKVVTSTTRAPRPGEIDGVHYNFRTPDEFKKVIARGDSIEYTEVYKDTFYGSDINAVNKTLEKADNAVLVIDVDGAQKAKKVLKEKGYNVAAIFLEPESMELLESRLRGRGTEAEAKILERLGKAKSEIEIAHKCGTYDAFVENNKNGVPENVEDFKNILL